MNTVLEIIERTYFPVTNISERDNRILKNRLGILAQIYFCKNNKMKWNILASYGSITTLENSLKSVLFEIKKRSALDFDIQTECDNFMKNNNYILCV
jgi:hypothetical protein